GNLYISEFPTLNKLITATGPIDLHGPKCRDYHDNPPSPGGRHTVHHPPPYRTPWRIRQQVGDRFEPSHEPKRANTFQWTPPTQTKSLRFINAVTGGVKTSVDPMIFDAVEPENKEIWSFELYPKYDWTITSWKGRVLNIDYPGSMAYD